MSFLNSFFRQQPMGHWDNVGAFGRLHTRTLPQMGCEVCEAEGWIPAMSRSSHDDSTSADLAAAKEDVEQAIAHLESACADSRVDPSVRRVALDALRDALTAIEAELEAGHAQP